MLTIVMAMSALEGINAVTGLPVRIKWPNDILIHRRKVAGILSEMSVRDGKIQYVVIGIGVNVNQEGFPKEIEKIATSLKKEGYRKDSRPLLAAEIVNAFDRDYELFLDYGDLSFLLGSYNELCVNANARCCIVDPSGEYEVSAEGINRRGALIVRMDSGETRFIQSGEVSVRGIYGYAE